MLLLKPAVAAAALAYSAHAWLPANDKIRGVGIGGLFVFEPWMDWQEWADIGCEGQQSEFDCVMNTGQDRSDAAFREHWENWINADDLDEMVSFGLNTIRIPLGYWLKEDLVDSSEHFPRGGLEFLTRFVGLASDRGLYIILDLHGGPGAQEPWQPFTGQIVEWVGFYNDYNYGRAVEWLSWMTEIVHTTHEYRNVGMIQLLNEPFGWGQAVDSLRSTFYVNAYNGIREVEKSLGVASNDELHVMMMSSNWGTGDPTEFLGDATSLAFDDHRYLRWDGDVPLSHEGYIYTSCYDDRNAETPTIVGEWSIAVADEVQDTPDWDPNTQQDFYRQWFAAQVQTYEKGLGWLFWTWKVNQGVYGWTSEDVAAHHGGQYRWSYRDSVAAGVISRNLDEVANSSVCRDLE
ncbi:glycoside hydrolase superfamily [Stachybotrys elegans]|uniref:glucan endo-1,6-beta-glucosidase n=1 Tax=Stachybotrys elegans TaxID=80388 RepID=A0A8K0ST01_9HYPO|nr:glycoside hydrolase superfamily [Stachybotrys elegans]